MTTMQDIAKMKDAELADFIREKRQAVRDSRFNAAMRDVRAIRTAKKDIARALTESARRMNTNA